jgi:hypothetical protein
VLDPVRRNAMSAAARERGRTYDIESAAARTEEIYHDLGARDPK